MSCSIVSVIQNKESDALNFIRRKYTSAYMKHINNAGLEEIAHQNVYKLVRDGEFSKHGKDGAFDSSCMCYICEKRGVKFDTQSDTMRSWLEMEEESETAISVHAKHERKLLFPFQIPQKNFDTIQSSSLVCDKCLQDIVTLQFEGQAPHPRMELEEEEEDYLRSLEQSFENDGVQICIDTCIICGEDYMITPEENSERLDSTTICSHTCDNCLMSNGYEEQPYFQIQTCNTCLNEKPYDLSLTGFINDAMNIEECPTCCLSVEENKQRDLFGQEAIASDLPFPEYRNEKTLHEEMMKPNVPEIYECEEFGEYYLGLWKYTNIAYMIYCPPQLEQSNIKRLSFCIFAIDNEFVQDKRNEKAQPSLFSSDNYGVKHSIHHDYIEQAIFMFGEDHHNTYKADWEGQINCLQTALKYAKTAYWDQNKTLRLYEPIN